MVSTYNAQDEPICETVIRYLPPDFTNKYIYEPFLREILGVVLENQNWRQGDPNRGEPDYFCKGIPIEFTLASDDKAKGNFIQRLKRGVYQTSDLERDACEYIQRSIEKKLMKTYSVNNVHLAVLCLMDLTLWVMDKYGSVYQDSLIMQKEELFLWIKETCIDVKMFSNVFLVFPDIWANWWVWDMRTGKRSRIGFSLKDMLRGQIPFWMREDMYAKLAGEGITLKESIVPLDHD